MKWISHIPNYILGVSREKNFYKMKRVWFQSKLNILSFKSNKFDLKHEIILIKRLFY